jgi:hypothetical protein
MKDISGLRLVRTSTNTFDETSESPLLTNSLNLNGNPSSFVPELKLLE